MPVQLHKNARTTPGVLAQLCASTQPTSVLARQYGLSEATVAKWRGRESTEDASHRPKRLQTTLSPVQEAIVVELRKTLLLPLDDLLALTQEFIHQAASRSALDRCPRRHGVSNFNALKPVQDDG